MKTSKKIKGNQNILAFRISNGKEIHFYKQNLHKSSFYTSHSKSDFVNSYSNLSFLGIKPPCELMVIAILLKWAMVTVLA